MPYCLMRTILLGMVAVTTSAAGTAMAQPAATSRATIAPGPFEPTFASMAASYEVPEWFRDAKFGIWAHWGPQCQPEAGDWYARHMYVQGHWQYDRHVRKYGHPSTAGFKDVINEWKAERWDPEALVALYKRAGAQYFFAMANHHDNLDLWDSKHQPWNSVRVGPKKDIVAGWAKAARTQGLKFGLSVHAAHAWSWYETAQGSDKTGEKAGVPYDGKLTKADGAGTWWDGLDPQDLYAQSHAPSPNFQDPGTIHARWEWGKGVTVPDEAYCQKFFDRTKDLIDTFEPDLIYYDDTIAPLYPISDVGLKLTAHFYNQSAAKNGGKANVVQFGKVIHDEQQRKAITWDVERGASNRIESFPWQTDTCIGDWHYNRDVFNRHRYKSATLVMQMLADIVSKNGNLLLNVPVRGDGTIDEDEQQVVAGITAWMDVNKEAIFGTRPFAVFGEGPASENAAPIEAQGFNEGKVPFGPRDVRFTTKGDKTLYAIALDWSAEPLTIRSLGRSAGHLKQDIASITLLGSDEAVQFERTDDAVTIQPAAKRPCDGPIVYRLTLK